MANATTFEETKNCDSYATTWSALEVVGSKDGGGLRELMEAQASLYSAFGMNSDSAHPWFGYGLDHLAPQSFWVGAQSNAPELRLNLWRASGDTGETSKFHKLGATESGYAIHKPSNPFARGAEGVIISVPVKILADRGGDPTCDRLSLHDATLAFSEGFGGVRPSASALENAEKLVRSAIAKCARADIDVDDNTGALAFDLRLSDGALLFAEIDVSGKLSADLFDDRGEESVWVKHFPNPSFSELLDALCPSTLAPQ